MKKDFGLLLLSSLAQTSCHGSGIVDHTTVFDSSSVNSEWIALVSNGASDRRWRKVEDVSFPASIKTRGKRDHYSEDEGARQYSEAVEVEHYVVQEKSEKDQLKDLISTPGTAGYIVFVYLGSVSVLGRHLN